MPNDEPVFSMMKGLCTNAYVNPITLIILNTNARMTIGTNLPRIVSGGLDGVA